VRVIKNDCISYTTARVCGRGWTGAELLATVHGGGRKNDPTNVVIRPRPAAIAGYADINHLRVPLRVPETRFSGKLPPPPRYVNAEIRRFVYYCIPANT